MLTIQYELFKIKEGEIIQEMHTKFISITNELHCLGEVIKTNKLVRKIFPEYQESKVNAITEAKDLHMLSIDELIENLKTYELKKKKKTEPTEARTKKGKRFGTQGYKK